MRRTRHCAAERGEERAEQGGAAKGAHGAQRTPQRTGRLSGRAFHLHQFPLSEGERIFSSQQAELPLRIRRTVRRPQVRVRRQQLLHDVRQATVAADPLRLLCGVRPQSVHSLCAPAARGHSSQVVGAPGRGEGVRGVRARQDVVSIELDVQPLHILAHAFPLPRRPPRRRLAQHRRLVALRGHVLALFPQHRGQDLDGVPVALRVHSAAVQPVGPVRPPRPAQCRRRLPGR